MITIPGDIIAKQDQNAKKQERASDPIAIATTVSRKPQETMIT